MRYPTLHEMYTSREWLETFLGYNHNLRIKEGEFYEMKNMSGDDYPVLSPRAKRGIWKTTGSPKGLIAKDKMCYVDGGILYIDGVAVEGLALTNDEKTLISMGAYIIILPDKKYINATNSSEWGNIENTYTSLNNVSYELSTIDGNPNGTTHTGETEPEEPEVGDLWIDTSTTPYKLMKHTASSSWVQVTTTYVKIRATNIHEGFGADDGITISGSTVITNGAYVIQGIGTDFIVISGNLETNINNEDKIKVERLMPKMDFIIESNNRLWGCYYGETEDGMVNEIYASKLGDFKNWSSFAGLSSDSYVATVGTDGAFTGAITYLGQPVFFKENCMHKVYGETPPYRIQSTACRGVQKGCGKSLVIVNEVLYYKSRGGVCSYDGSLPTEISYAFGGVQYENAVAGPLGNKYYISMKPTSSREHDLFVYDTVKNMWHREDNTQAIAFCNYQGNLYYIDNADNYIKTVKGIEGHDGVLEGREISWEVVTGTLATDSPDKKYISRLDVRMKINVGARVSFYVQYNSEDEWQHLYTMTGTTLKSFAVPIRPERCDHLKLRIVGLGDAKIYSICKTIEQGSDV